MSREAKSLAMQLPLRVILGGLGKDETGSGRRRFHGPFATAHYLRNKLRNRAEPANR